MDNVEEINSLVRMYLKKRLNSNIPEDYEISLLNKRNRGIIAKRNFKIGDVIFLDVPIVFGPRFIGISSPVCVGCHRIFQNLKACSKGCKLPICSLLCENSETHKFECEFFRCETVCSTSNSSSEKEWSLELSKAVISVRCLKLDSLQIEILRRLHRIKTSGRSAEVDLLKNYAKINLQKDEEDFMRLCCCVLDANAYEVSCKDRYGTQTNLRALYPLASFVNHSCSPNTSHIFDQDHRMIMRATVPIGVGQEITTSYCSVFLSTPARRNFLVISKHFLCSCDRCHDNTEFGTYLSALNCRRTNDCSGLLLPSDPLNFQSDWTCTLCRENLSPCKIAILQNVVANEIKLLNLDNPSLITSFINECKLPNTNHIRLELKLRLVHTLGYVDGYKWNELSDADLKLKKDICIYILDVVSKLKLGLCRIKGFCMLQLCLTLLEIQNRGVKNSETVTTNIFKEFNMNEMKAEINEVYKCDEFPPDEVTKLNSFV